MENVPILLSELIAQGQKAIAEHGDMYVLITLADHYEGWTGNASAMRVRNAYDFEGSPTEKVAVFD